MWRKTMLLALAAFLFTIAVNGCGKPETARRPERTGSPAAVRTDGTHPAGELAGEKVLLVVAPKDFRDEEFFTPRRVLEEKGAQVTVASSVKETAKGMLGGTVRPGAAFSEVRGADYDAVVIAGGAGSKLYLWDDRELCSHIVGEASRGAF